MLGALTKKDLFLNYERIKFSKPIGLQKNILNLMEWDYFHYISNKEEAQKKLKKINDTDFMSENELHKFKVISNDGIDLMILKHFNRTVYTLNMRDRLKLSNEQINIASCELIIKENLERV